MKQTLITALLVPCMTLACQSTDPSGSIAAPAPAPTESTLQTGSTTGADASTLDGVYTTAQATRGAGVFRDVCAECHDTEDWTEAPFRARWQDESVYRFWYYVYEQMPNGAPPYSLSREQVTDVVAYIFELNNLPTGAAELGSDDDSIDDYWLRWPEDGHEDGDPDLR